MPSLVGLTQSSLEPGNDVRILQNGDGVFPPMMRDIAAAKESIHLESYIWYDGKLTRQLIPLLARKARQGVEVRVLVDGSGGKELKGDAQKTLEDAGVKVAHFPSAPLRQSRPAEQSRSSQDGHPRRPAGLHRRLRLRRRMDRQRAGQGALTRDTGLRIAGPVVHRLQAAFSENWIEETGEITRGHEVLPAQSPRRAPRPRTWPTPRRPAACRRCRSSITLAIKAARHEIIIQNPYLLPDRAAIDALEEAVSRGVDVKIMVPSTDATDNRSCSTPATIISVPCSSAA